MMLQQNESKSSGNSSGNSNPGQLLRDIEEISKALYLHKPSQKLVLPSSDGRSKSAEKTRFGDSKSDSNPTFLREDLLHKGKKASSIWNWKKPLRALTHIGNRKLNCCFYLHVHSLEGLPVNFNNLSLSVHWKRKDEVLQTSYTRVEGGVAEFDETLMHRSTVYGSRNGHNHSVKYEEKLFLIYVSVNEAPGLDTGKHRVDLTRLLPLTFEELEGEKSFGKWTTSFNLSGKATGANLNVSMGFLVTQDKLGNLNTHPSVAQLINTEPKRSSSLDSGARILRRVGSVPSSVNSRPAFSSQTLDLKVGQEVMLTGGLDLSKSITLLCQALDEGKSEQVEPLKPQPEPDIFSDKGIEDYEDDDVEFTIVEVGTEIPEKEQLSSDRIFRHADDESAVKIIYADDVIQDYDLDLGEKTMVILKDRCDGNYVDEVMENDVKHEDDSMCRKGSSTTQEVESDSHIQESAELNHLFAPGEFLEERSHMELKSTYASSKIVRKSLSLDDVTESVSNEFLSMLGMDGCLSSDSDPESPREILLKEFEKEALTSGNVFNFDWKEEQPDIGNSVLPSSDWEDCFENSDLSMIIQAAEEEDKRESELLKRRKAKILEGLETEALMREWGLNEQDFQNSPHLLSGGFGSPIYVPMEEPLLAPLEVGLGSYVQMKDGGFLRSMNPSLFRNAKNGGNLFIQISNPVVIPAKMGYDVEEILQHFALVGIDKLYMQVNNLMPLEDITGKTIHQVASEAIPSTVASERFEQILYGESTDEGFKSSLSCNGLIAELNCNEMGSDYASLENLAPLAMKKIEALSLEGLRIQSRMSDLEAPSSIYPHVNCGEIFRSRVADGLQPWEFRDSDDDAAAELMDLSLSLEEWLRLDAKFIADEDQSREKLLKTLSAHHAKGMDLPGVRLTEDMNHSDISDRNCAILGKNLTIVLRVQLRDPFRNYEPVGVPMIALIQVERVLAHSMPQVASEELDDSNEKERDEPILEETSDEEAERNDTLEESNPQFKIIDVHLAGVDTAPDNRQLWGTTTQMQSGSRWLLAAGLGKTIHFPLSNSKAIVVRSSPLLSAKMQCRDSLWSISSTSHGHGATWKDLTAPHIRNPNIIFPNETINPTRNM